MNWKELFDYEHITGELRWKHYRPLAHFKNERGMAVWLSLFAGEKAGSFDSEGYLNVGVFGRKYKVHRVIWEMNNGMIPALIDIDHVNGVKHDNRISNLRLATRSQNCHNSKTRINNTIGMKGVSWNKQHGKYVAMITTNSKKKYLGYFDTPEEAHSAYCSASYEMHGEYGRPS